MNCGLLGLGKLGLPVATAMASRGLTVYGVDPHVSDFPASLDHEAGWAEVREQAGDRVKFTTLADAVANCEVLFVACQTPHDPRYEGVTPLPDERVDFDYTYLTQAVAQVADEAFHQDRRVTVCVISTVLPGTMERVIEPLLGQYVSLVYSPSFIAMGTTIRDFLDPEFVLIGGDDDGTLEKAYRAVYKGSLPRFVHTSVKNAELIKVAYNTFIGLKIAFANTVMEVCHKTGCDIDEVTGALKHAHRRLISTAYLDGGMGDGGGCHPRDNIALSWLARKLDLSYDLFESAMVCRERQAEWLVDLMCEVDLPKAIYGIAYKPGSHITTGSPALLVKHQLQQRGHHVFWHDPHASAASIWPEDPHVFLIGCRHPEFETYEFPEGSVVIDPFRYIPDQEGVEVVRLGEGVNPVADNRPATASEGVHRQAA